MGVFRLAWNSKGPTKRRGMGGALKRSQSEVTCFQVFLLFFSTCTNCICLCIGKGLQPVSPLGFAFQNPRTDNFISKLHRQRCLRHSVLEMLNEKPRNFSKASALISKASAPVAGKKCSRYARQSSGEFKSHSARDEGAHSELSTAWASSSFFIQVFIGHLLPDVIHLTEQSFVTGREILIWWQFQLRVGLPAITITYPVNIVLVLIKRLVGTKVPAKPHVGLQVLTATLGSALSFAWLCLMARAMDDEASVGVSLRITCFSC